jgi:microcompartment protein CcmL/EutN
MNGKALGIIETVGLIPAVEAGDVAVKTADVSIIGSQAVGGGLVSILMTGDVSAVKAAVDAGSTAAARLGEVISMTVIARTAEGLDQILIDEAKRPRCGSGAKASKPPEPERCFAPEVVAENLETDPVEEPPTVVQEPEGVESIRFDLAELKKLKVTKLRRLARQIPDFSIARGEIKYAKKKDLLEAFTHYISILT